jgi:hypothetical protein
LVQLEICNGLPLVGSYEPLVVFASAAKVDDELGFVVVESFKDGFKTVHGEGGIGEKIRCYDNLLHTSSAIMFGEA